MKHVKNLYSGNIDIYTAKKKLEYSTSKLKIQNHNSNKLVLDIFKFITKRYDAKHDKEKTEVMFSIYKKFFKNRKFLKDILQLSLDENNFRSFKNQKNFIFQFLSFSVDVSTIWLFKYGKCYKKLSPKCKKIINKYNDTKIDKRRQAELNIPLKYRKISIKRKLDRRLSVALLNYLKWKYPMEEIWDLKIEWRYNKDGIQFKQKNNVNPIDELAVLIKQNKNKTNRFIVSPLSLVCSIEKEKSRHRNILIYDKKYNIIERFEPLGTVSLSHYKPFMLDNRISKIMNKYGIKYLAPYKFMPVWGPQSYQSKYSRERIFKKTGEPGRCIAWSIWYADIRLGNPDIGQFELLFDTINFLKRNHIQLTNYIRNYMFRVASLDDIISITNNDTMINLIDKYIEHPDLDIDRFIDVFCLLLYIILSVVCENIDVKICINGKIFDVVEPDKYSCLKKIKTMKFRYGKKIIDYNKLKTILQSNYEIYYLQIKEVNIDNIHIVTKYIDKMCEILGITPKN